jgi:hypothetical protein
MYVKAFQQRHTHTFVTIQSHTYVHRYVHTYVYLLIYVADENICVTKNITLENLHF